MILRIVSLALLLFGLNACTSAPDIDGLPQEEHAVVVLGGSTFGVAVASALKGYDEEMDVVLLERNPFFVTEPYINLYLGGKLDEKLVFKPYAQIAKRHGFTWMDETAVYIDRDRKLVVLKDRVIRYKRLVDARYDYENGQSEGMVLNDSYDTLRTLQARLAENRDQSILVDASALPLEEKIRAEELTNILKMNKNRLVAYRQGEGAVNGTYDLVIRYPRYTETAALRFSENFFVQYNRGLETVAEIVREDFGGSFLPNMVKEERFIYQNAETLQGIDPETNQTKEGTDYLSKVIKIQRDFM